MPQDDDSMKRLLIILFFLPLINNGQTSSAKNDSVLEIYIDTIIGKDTIFLYPYYYDNEYYQSLTDDSLPDGQYNAYFNDSSTLAFKGRYKNGKPQGIFHYYRKNGRVRHTCVYEKGIENGPFTFYNENGQLVQLGQEINNKQDGTDYQWYSNGNYRHIDNYKLGKFHGSYKYFHYNGQIDTEGNYFEGYDIGKWTSYYDNGKIREIRYFVDSIGIKEKQRIVEWQKNHLGAAPYFPIGTTINYDKLGNKIAEHIYKDFFLVKSIKYYSNGREKEIINYVDFHQGFCSQNPSYYIKGGQYLEFYENGNKKTEGNYSDNTKDGEWKLWAESGQFLKTEIYKKGKLKK